MQSTATTTNAGCQLPPECLAIIVDYLTVLGHSGPPRIDHLYQYLTVNKVFFSICVEKLYRAPVQTITNDSSNHLPRWRKLVVLILKVSPSKEPLVERLRDIYQHELEQLSLVTTTPLADYLSFIHVMCFEPPILYWLHDEERWIDDEKHEVSLVGFETVLWAACAHRFSEVKALSLPSRTLSRYMDYVDQMTALVRLDIVFHCKEYTERTRLVIASQLQQAIDLTRKIMQEPRTSDGDNSNKGSNGGDNKGQSLQSSSNKTTLDIFLRRYGRPKIVWMDFQPQIKELYSYLPVVKAQPIISDSKAPYMTRFLVAPESVDVSTIQEIKQILPYNAAQYHPSLFPPQGKSQLLARCRSLQRLEFVIGQEPNSCDDEKMVFEWAVKERQEAIAATKEGGSPPPRPLVPLKHLSLVIKQHFRKVLRTNDLMAQIVFAFRPTLQTISIGGINRALKIDLSVFHDMPQLKSLELWHTSILSCTSLTAMPFSNCPNLEKLRLRDFCNESDSHLSHFSCIWDIPSLTNLSLAGNVAYRFNQASFQTMLNLETLYLKSNMDEMDQSPDALDDPENFSWSLQHFAYLTQLKQLYLYGTMAYQFQLSWLVQHCPRIESVKLTSREWFDRNDDVPTLAPRFGDLAALLKQQPQRHAPLESLKTMYIEGWDVAAQDNKLLLDLLPTMAPNLRALNLRCTGYEKKPVELAEAIKTRYPKHRVAVYFYALLVDDDPMSEFDDDDR